MHVLVVGAAGMIGRKLCARLAADGTVAGRPIDKASLVDIIQPTPPAASFPVEVAAFDMAAPYVSPKLVAGRPDLIFLLASVVSGEAEADFEKGYAINLDGTRGLFEAIRREHVLSGGAYRPRVVFTSSIAVFGAPFPEVIGDEFLSAPLTSYGAQKSMCETLLGDYSRRGFLDGVGLRLPTICVRPGAPNKAASGFYSNMIREPLKGEEAVLPVPETIRHWFASPRAAVEFLLRAATVDTRRLGDRRSLTMPGLSATVGEQIEALTRIAGERVAARIRREPDPAVLAIVEGWPERFDTVRAHALGFRAESSFEEIIRIHIEDELGGSFVA